MKDDKMKDDKISADLNNEIDYKLWSYTALCAVVANTLLWGVALGLICHLWGLGWIWGLYFVLAIFGTCISFTILYWILYWIIIGVFLNEKKQKK